MRAGEVEVGDVVRPARGRWHVVTGTRPWRKKWWVIFTLTPGPGWQVWAAHDIRAQRLNAENLELLRVIADGRDANASVLLLAYLELVVLDDDDEVRVTPSGLAVLEHSAVAVAS